MSCLLTFFDLLINSALTLQWLQRVHAKKLARLRREVQRVASSLTKKEVDLDLEFWEQQAQLEDGEGEERGDSRSSDTEASEEAKETPTGDVKQLEQHLQKLDLASQT